MLYTILAHYVMETYDMKAKVEKVGYARVSTTEQHIENQINQLLAAGVPADYIFVDRGLSGKIPPRKRPGFKKLVSFLDAHKGQVRCLLTAELSRLGRTTLETISVISEMEALGVIVWSLSPNESFTRSEDAAVRQLMIMILSWVAERERANLIERTRAGIDRARAEGKHLGRPRADIDWDRVAEMRDEGRSWAEVAEDLGLSYQQLWRRRGAAGRL